MTPTAGVSASHRTGKEEGFGHRKQLPMKSVSRQLLASELGVTK